MDLHVAREAFEDELEKIGEAMAHQPPLPARKTASARQERTPEYMAPEQPRGIDADLFKAASFDIKKALKSGLEEGGPALGATLGAALAAGHGKPALSGAALGYGVGALPELLHSKSHKG